MITVEEALTISRERLNDCKASIDIEFSELMLRAEDSGFTRKEILAAISHLTAEELSALPDMPRVL